MAASNPIISSSSSAGAFVPAYAGWSKEETTEDKVQKLMVSKFTEIVSDYDRKKQSGSVKDLATGPWYPSDYAIALEKLNQTKRLEFLVKKDAFFHGFAPKGFEQLDNPETPTGKQPMGYVIKADCLPTQALENVRSGQFSLIDCGNAVELAMYATLREVLGDQRFNSRFSGDGPSPLTLHPHVQKNPLYSLGFVKEVRIKSPDEVRLAEMLALGSHKPHQLSHVAHLVWSSNLRKLKDTEVQLGDDAHFSNVPLYSLKHPNGESGGFHTVCVTPSDVKEKIYIAFGTSEDGKTEDGMEDLLIADFNAKPIEPSLVSTAKLTQIIAEKDKTNRAAFSASTGQKIADFTMNRNDFKAAIEGLGREQVGLHPVVRRLNVETIRENLE